VAIKTELEKKYYYHATVIIAVDSMARTRGKIYVSGSVRAAGPQEIPSDETLTLSKAILRAGGFTDYADKHNVTITRKKHAPVSDIPWVPGSTGSGAGEQKLTVDVAKILEKGKTDLDVPLEPDDLIIVLDKVINF
jgi:protein involved in polysaccharide export with SLBB domain